MIARPLEAPHIIRGSFMSMGFGASRPERKAGSHRLGLMFLVIKHARILEIMVESDGSLTTNDPIKGKIGRRGLATAYR